MIEAQILCSHPCDIPDLGILNLKRGEERWVSVAAAQASRDLVKEQTKGNIRVYRKARRAEPAPRRPAPPFVAGSRPQTPDRREFEAMPKPVVVEAAEPRVDLEALARKMKIEMMGDLIPDLQEVIAREIGKALASQPRPETPQPSIQASGLDAALLESVLEGVLKRAGVSGGAQATRGGGSKPKGTDEPLFIPSVLVDKGAKGKITVTSKQSEGADDLDDAQAALREMKKLRRKKNGDEEQ